MIKNYDKIITHIVKKYGRNLLTLDTDKFLLLFEYEYSHLNKKPSEHISMIINADSHVLKHEDVVAMQDVLVKTLSDELYHHKYINLKEHKEICKNYT